MGRQHVAGAILVAIFAGGFMPILRQAYLVHVGWVTATTDAILPGRVDAGALRRMRQSNMAIAAGRSVVQVVCEMQAGGGVLVPFAGRKVAHQTPAIGNL